MLDTLEAIVAAELGTRAPSAYLIATAAALGGILLLALTLWIRAWRRRLRWPMIARQVLSAPELQLHRRLVRALPQQIVLAQVQVSRVLDVRPGFDFHEWNNRINRMSYDFVVCAPDGTVVAAIELDDSSHERADRIAADAKKDAATASAGVPMIRWHVRAIPDVRTIQATIKGLPRVPDAR